MTDNLKFMRKIAIVAAFCLSSLAQSTAQELSGNVMDVYQRHMISHRYFEAFLESKKYPVPRDVSNSLEMQTQLTFSSFLGSNRYYDELINEWESGFQANDSLRALIHDTPFQDDKAIAEIIESARGRQVVMINENHFYPHHRLLAVDLLPRLKELGYTYLALETLYDGQDTALNDAGSYPTLQTGFYTREQTFSYLLRQAKQLGFQFVSYENSDQEKDREMGQAANLYRKTLGEDPSAKVFVLAGISHIMEKPDGRGKKWMAAIFKDTYGIDPLTISQTSLNMYRHDVSGDYALLDSGQVEGWNGLDAFDFLMVNKKSNPDFWDSKMEYRNASEEDVQVAVFHVFEIEDLLSLENNIPYFTTVLRADERIGIPYNQSEGGYLIVYGGAGNVIEKRYIR